MDKYSISTRTDHGIALIIHNRKWKADPEPRVGSEKDVHAFQEIAKMLNYKIVVEEDLTGKGMCEVMVRVGTMVDGSHDSFICFITSHGSNLGVLGVDEEPINVTHLADLIGPQKCPKLTNKPKIFIIQACRGTDLHNEVQFDSNDPSDPTPIKNEEIQFDGKMRGIPPTADYLFAYCTTPSTKAMRTASTGSYYVKVLHEMLTKYASKLGLYEILLMVHNELATNDKYVYEYKFEGDEKWRTYRQMGEVVSTLRKKVYFK